MFEVGVGLELELSDNLIGGVGGVKLGLSKVWSCLIVWSWVGA